MNSAAFLRRGIAPTPPLPAAGLPLTFRRNVSSSIRLFAYENKQHGNRSSNDDQRCNNGSQIRCNVVKRTQSSGSGGEDFPFVNAKMALQSLLCFSLDTAVETETKYISDQKKKALQALIAMNKPAEAERIMTDVYKRYRGASGTINYDATLALIEILIHIGTRQSLGTAVGYLNNIEETKNLPSDAKRNLYRAVIYTLLGDNSSAKVYWKTYNNSIGRGPPRR